MDVPTIRDDGGQRGGYRHRLNVRWAMDANKTTALWAWNANIREDIGGAGGEAAGRVRGEGDIHVRDRVRQPRDRRPYRDRVRHSRNPAHSRHLHSTPSILPRHPQPILALPFVGTPNVFMSSHVRGMRSSTHVPDQHLTPTRTS